MFDRLIDLIADFGQSLVPWFIVDQNESAIVLRLGKMHRRLGPGFHWRIPFGVDVMQNDNTTWRTHFLAPQSLVTADKKLITIRGVVTWKILDMEYCILWLDDVEDVLTDTLYDLLATAVQDSEYDYVLDAEFMDDILKMARDECGKRGLHVEKFRLAEMSQARVLRLVGAGDWAGA